MSKDIINPDVKFIDASEWYALDWLSTGGTRSKRVLMDDDGRLWYFKCSEKKEAKNGNPAKHYKFEFWSEVIGYQIGNLLGLEILRYDVAINGGEIGCISPLMINSDESLIEVGRYMTAINPDFLPENNAARKQYTFQLLESTIDHFELSKYWSFLFKTILFDAIIGNTDRHQENWAFIRNINDINFVERGLEELEKDIKSNGLQKTPRFLRWLVSPFVDKEKDELNITGKAIQLSMTKISRIAPIYDSGSSLGRELKDERVELFLNDEQAFSKYVHNGLAEIHWEGQKITHFQLVENLLNSAHHEQVIIASKFLEDWNEDKIEQIINGIDSSVSEEWNYLCIPAQRKKLIIKLLSSRTKKLKEIINAGV
jgi:hypothetical protein